MKQACARLSGAADVFVCNSFMYYIIHIYVFMYLFWYLSQIHVFICLQEGKFCNLYFVFVFHLKVYLSAGRNCFQMFEIDNINKDAVCQNIPNITIYQYHNINNITILTRMGFNFTPVLFVKILTISQYHNISISPYPNIPISQYPNITISTISTSFNSTPVLLVK